MKYFVQFVVLLLILTRCYSAETFITKDLRGEDLVQNLYIYHLEKQKELPFYFLLNHDSKEVDYKFIAC